MPEFQPQLNISQDANINLLNQQYHSKDLMNQAKQELFSRYIAPQDINDEFIFEHKKNGLFERLYNGLKNLTGFGTGSNRVKAALGRVQTGELSEDDAREVIKKYRSSQASSAQAFGDLVSIGAAAGTYFSLRKENTFQKVVYKLNKKFSTIDEFYVFSAPENDMFQIAVKSYIKRSQSKIGERANKKFGVIILALSALTGGIAKYFAMKADRIGSKEYKADKEDFNNLSTAEDKFAYKLYKKSLKSEARKSSFRNFASGIINGLTLPITLIGGGLVGTPVYLAVNSLNRFFVGNNNEKEKSFNKYVNDLKDNGILHAGVMLAAGIPLIKKGKFSAVFEENLQKAFKKIDSHSELINNPYDGKTAYNEVQDIMLNSSEIEELITGRRFTGEFSVHEYTPKNISWKVEKEIPERFQKYIKETYGKNIKIEEVEHVSRHCVTIKIKLPNQSEGKWIEIKADNEVLKLSLEERILKLIDKNIFAAKFLQIGNKGDFAKVLQENCPPTRTLEQAKEAIKKVFGSKYEVKELMGAGTVAETYLAKDKDGKEVCIKILREGMNADKIKRDKEDFLNIIKNLKDKSPVEKEYLTRSVEGFADDIMHEIDLNNEFTAAKKLVKYTKTAKVVKPIEVKDGMYVMEKADGISFRKLINLNNIDMNIKDYEDKLKDRYLSESDKEYFKKELKRLKEEKAEMLGKYKNFKIVRNDVKYMIDEYMKVLVEQLYKVDGKARTLHADIHPGNIFIDVDALRSRKGKIFTLIDTGNTIDLTAEQAMQSMKIVQYIERGDTKDLAKYFMENADLRGSKLSKEEACTKIEEALNKIFFDPQIRANNITSETIINNVSNIMRSHNIMPGAGQLNLMKARKSADKSFDVITDVWFEKFDRKYASPIDKVKMMGEAAMILNKYLSMKKAAERKGLIQMIKHPKEYIKARTNPNFKPLNSEESLIYQLKQEILSPEWWI